MKGFKIKDMFCGEKKSLKADLCFTIALGVLLIILGNTFFFGGDKKAVEAAKITNEATETTDSGYASKLENRLEKLLSKVEGAGNVKVMISLSSGSEIVIAEEVRADEDVTDEASSNGDERSMKKNSMESKAVLLTKSDGSSTPLVLKELEPTVIGVVIIADGADDIKVKDCLIRASEALLDVPAHKVAVFKMKSK